MKRRNLLRSRSGRKESSRQKVERIPNPVAAENSIKHSHDGHGYASCQTPFDTRRNRIDLQRQSSPVQFLGLPFDASNLWVAGFRSWDSPHDWHGFVFLVGQHVAKPAHTTG